MTSIHCWRGVKSTYFDDPEVFCTVEYGISVWPSWSYFYVV
jgi:hypothetical protein